VGAKALCLEIYFIYVMFLKLFNIKNYNNVTCCVVGRKGDCGGLLFG
jgi:hypothetical protein